MSKETTCAVPGCENTLSEEQKNSKTTICSNCEAAKMHICESCGNKISPARIKEGAILCRQCEMNPSDLNEAETEALEYEPEGFML